MDKASDIKQLNLLSLAFVGDSVFSLKVRSFLIMRHDFKPNELNRLANKFVSATAQAKMYDAIIGSLREEELELARRARNAHTNNKAKNASLSDYKKATSLETIIGYYYLTEDFERLEEIQNFCLNVILNKIQTKQEN